MKLRSGKILEKYTPLPITFDRKLKLNLEALKGLLPHDEEFARELIKLIANCHGIDERFLITDKIREAYPDPDINILGTAGSLLLLLVGKSYKYHDLIREKMLDYCECNIEHPTLIGETDQSNMEE